MRKNNRALKILSLSGASLALLIICATLAFEKIASKNIGVNISKRVVAEAGAAISATFLKNDNANHFAFGPKDAAEFTAGRQEAVKYLSGYSGVSGIKWDDHEISGYAGNFDYENLSDPHLELLNKSYLLDDVVSTAKNEFEKFIILRHWVRSSIPRGSPKNVDYNFNALDILNRAGKGEQFFCSEYSTVFTQCALSVGLQARYIGLFKGHAVTEVWSDEYVKWAVMDVDNDLHYERNGLPLDALELHDAFESNRFDDIKLYRGPGKSVVSGSEKKELLSYYHEFYVRMRNDWFSNRYPHWHNKGNSIMNGLEWQDRYTGNNILIANETSDKKRLYFPLNVVNIIVDRPLQSSSSIRLVLKTFTPGFSHFLLSIDGGVYSAYREPVYDWNLHTGENAFAVKAVNILGIEGPESTATLVLD